MIRYKEILLAIISMEQNETSDDAVTQQFTDEEMALIVRWKESQSQDREHIVSEIEAHCDK